MHSISGHCWGGVPSVHRRRIHSFLVTFRLDLSMANFYFFGVKILPCSFVKCFFFLWCPFTPPFLGRKCASLFFFLYCRNCSSRSTLKTCPVSPSPLLSLLSPPRILLVPVVATMLVAKVDCSRKARTKAIIVLSQLSIKNELKKHT